MQLQGVVRNITEFGAFVDIGLHNDGLVHKSQMADRYVGHPIDIVSLGQQVNIKVIDIDLEREKVSLSMKLQNNTAPKTTTKQSTPTRKEPGSLGESTVKGNISWS